MAGRRARHVPADPFEPLRSDSPFRAVTVRLPTGQWQLCVLHARSCLPWVPRGEQPRRLPGVASLHILLFSMPARASEWKRAQQTGTEWQMSVMPAAGSSEGRKTTLLFLPTISLAREPPPRLASWCKQSLGTFSSFQVPSQHKPILLLFPTWAVCYNVHVIISQLSLEIFLLQVLAGSFPHSKDS